MTDRWESLDDDFRAGRITLQQYGDTSRQWFDEEDHETVPVQRRDVRTSMTALVRWAEQCAPGADKHLREVIARLDGALKEPR